MPQSLPILVTVVIAAATIAINAVINIKVKFAPDAASAASQVKAVAWRIARWILNLALVGSLITSVRSPEPLTRLAVLQIAMSVAAITSIVVMDLIGHVIRILDRVVDAQGKHSDFFGRLLDTVDKLQQPQ